MAIDNLTPAQKQAVLRRCGPILVSAAAGSGKTRVIVERLMQRILDPADPCSIDEFLIITFTKKAAAELRAKIAKELAECLAQHPEYVHLQKQQSRLYMAQISTVHSFCGDLLREFSYDSGVPSDFRMLEETEAAALREELANELLEDRYETILDDEALRQLVDGLGAGRDDRQIPKLMLNVYQTAQCHLDPEGWLDECGLELDREGITGAEQTAFGAYMLDAFRKTVKELLSGLELTLRDLEGCDSLKKYEPVLQENEALLRSMQAVGTWDEAWSILSAKPDLGRLPPVRNCGDPFLQSRVKSVRKEISDRLGQWAEDIYGPSQTVLADLRQNAVTLRALFALTKDFSARYQAEKRRLHALDFNDLEHGAVRLLLEKDGVTPTAMGEQISQRYREIMVDEYQDTNQVQDSIFRALSREGKNRFMVGDVKQSIYRFRLAEPEIFVDKYNRYPDAGQTEDGERQRILLSHNFRSGEPILEAVNAVFSRCMSPEVGGLSYGASELLRPGCPHPPLAQTQVEFHCLNTKAEDDAQAPDKNRAEAAFAAQRIRSMLRSGIQVREGDGTRPAEPGDFVILLRSPKNTAGFFLEALQRVGVPAVSDTGESVLDSAEVEILLSVLKVLDNAHQDIPLTGALLSPAFGVSASELARVRKSEPHCDLFDAVCAAKDGSPALRSAVETIRELRVLCRELPLYALVERVLQKTGFEAVCGAMAEPQKRRGNLQIFVELAASFCEGGKKSLHQFLNFVEQLREKGGVSLNAEQTNAVRVMSIHKSKGLEFPIVFLCDLSKRFNLEDLQSQVLLHSELGAGCNIYDSETHTRFASLAKTAIGRRTRADNLSEELRILYVAMTRAKDRLVMTYCSGNLESKLQNLALRLSPENSRSQAAKASCLGDWVLQTALLRQEAEPLHAVTGVVPGTECSDHPWQITWQDLSDADQMQAASGVPVHTGVIPDFTEALQALDFRYPHEEAVRLPSKLTATQLKGRQLDEEADDGRPAADRVRRKLRQPSLIREEIPLTSAQKGTAVHLAMQYLDFAHTDSVEQIEKQLLRMEEDRFLTPAQIKAVDPMKLYAVFHGPLGEKLRAAEQVIREFKFSVLTRASELIPGAGSDEILLQGVTDCCLIKNGGLTVIDFKTDRIKPGDEAISAARYRPQLDAYSLALERIFCLPVSERILYFFATGQMTVI